jgi:segregation and condensation protein B
MLAQSIDGVGKEELATLLEQLVVEYRTMNRPFHLVEVAGGWQFRTRAEYGPYIQRVNHDRPTKLSRASLETLAVIAYKQPITRPEIEDLRGVDSGAVVKNLLERGLIKIVGKKDAPGKPVVYGTAPRFLEVFSLRDLGSLPSLRDLKELDEGESGQLALPAVEGVEGVEGEEGTAVEPKQLTDSERRKQIRESIRGLLSIPVNEDGTPVETELPPPPDDEDDAMAELEAALKRRKEAAERADAIFEDGEKDYIEKITTENVPDEGAAADLSDTAAPESAPVAEEAGAAAEFSPEETAPEAAGDAPEISAAAEAEPDAGASRDEPAPEPDAAAEVENASDEVVAAASTYEAVSADENDQEPDPV